MQPRKLKVSPKLLAVAAVTSMGIFGVVSTWGGEAPSVPQPKDGVDATGPRSKEKESPEAQAKRIHALIEQLGDEEFAKRASATKTLLEIGDPAYLLVKAALKTETQLERRARLLTLANRLGMRAARMEGGEASAHAFIKAMATGDPGQIMDFYDDSVVLMAGSELLKPEWGLAKSRVKDAEVSKARLAGAVKQLIDGAGVPKWCSLWKAVKKDRTTVVKATQADQRVGANTFRGVQPGDSLLVVQLSPGMDDKLAWAFRKNANGEWRIVREWTDY